MSDQYDCSNFVAIDFEIVPGKPIEFEVGSSLDWKVVDRATERLRDRLATLFTRNELGYGVEGLTDFDDSHPPLPRYCVAVTLLNSRADANTIRAKLEKQQPYWAGPYRVFDNGTSQYIEMWCQNPKVTTYRKHLPVSSC